MEQSLEVVPNKKTIVDVLEYRPDRHSRPGLGRSRRSRKCGTLPRYEYSPTFLFTWGQPSEHFQPLKVEQRAQPRPPYSRAPPRGSDPASGHPRGPTAADGEGSHRWYQGVCLDATGQQREHLPSSV